MYSIERAFVPVTIVLALSICATAAAQGGDRQRVEFLLSAYEGFPTAKSFLDVTPDPAIILREIATDPDSKEHIRHGALSAMAFFPDEKTWELYQLEWERATSNPAPRSVHHVLQGLALGFGPRATPALVKALGHADTQVRMTAAFALGTVGTDDARGAILDQAQREADPVVAKYMRQQVP